MKKVICEKPGLILCADTFYLMIDDVSLYFNIPKKLTDRIIDTVMACDLLRIPNLFWLRFTDFPQEITDHPNFPTKNELHALYKLKGGTAGFQENVMNMVKEQIIIEANLSNRYSLLFFRKIQKINDFPVLKACRTYAVFSHFKEFKVLSMVNMFLLYNMVADEEFLFRTNSLRVFSNKYRLFLNIGIEAFIHKNVSNANAKKVSKKDLDIIMREFQKGDKFSFSKLLRDLNTRRIASGEEQRISKSTVRRYILNSPEFGIADLTREGSDGIKNMMTHALREQPGFAGDQYQIDGTRLNFLYKDDDGKKIGVLYMVVAIDVYSKKVVGYSLSPSETFGNYIEAIRVSVKNHKILPAEILTDNFQSGQNKMFTRFVGDLQSLGIRFKKHRPYNPQAKGSIESWFFLFNEMYLKEFPGYLGDGIRSRRKNGKPNSDLLASARKKKNIRTKEELIQVFTEAVINYNSTYEFKNSTPNLLFGNSLPKHVVHLNDVTLPIVMMESTPRTILKNSVAINKNGVTYEYIIYDSDFLTKYRKKDIIVRYNVIDNSEVLIYDDSGLNLLLRVGLHSRLVNAEVNQSEDDRIDIFKYTQRNKLLLRELTSKVEDYKNSFNNIPINAVDHKIDTKENIHLAEEKYLLEADNNKTSVKGKIGKRDISRIKKLSLKKIDVTNTEEKIVVSFKDMFKVKGSIKRLD
ncbi:transposase [Mucilaginibacter sp. HC2]|uniref:DDE-type integrase/transposase/recombinase n=1 Tax=Mucilaginibacter inviolabilis TaxID=2714892 RepID=UPI00140C9EFF|nr:DDE-type integrase/transposase/recombinase [Mucilaginibacter inviolabilis]NHA04888.1 transposase [Mucilaginibacter inviolabilis]